MDFRVDRAGVLRGRSCADIVLAVLLAASTSFICGPAYAADLGIARSFFPSETAATVANPSGAPPSALVKDADGRVLGYAFSTRDVSGSVGYSGRPLDIVAAVTSAGIIAGARIVAHEEPILVIGVPREALTAYVADFKGFDVRAAAQLRSADRIASGPQAVAGASVTSAVIRDAIVRSARAILRARPELQHEVKPRLDRENARRSSWPALAAEGALRQLMVTRGRAAQLLGTRDDQPDQTFIELWLALVTPSAIGESLVGQREYESAIAGSGPDDDFILVAANGLYSFKGTEWRRSGVFDRIEILQGSMTIRLRSEDHRRVDMIRAPGAPEFREIGLFRIAHGSGFDPTAPFRLDLMITSDSPTGRIAQSAIVSLEYQVPDAYVVRPPPIAAAVHSEDAAKVAVDSPGAATAPPPDATEQADTMLWQDIWWSRRVEIAALAIMLTVLGGILIFQSAVTANGSAYRLIRIGYLLATFGFLGLVAKAQLSVVNVVTFIHALLTGFRWELFLLDPLVFILWGFVAASMLFWGRGVFCGWLCPFGALQELLFKLSGRLGLKQIEVPFNLHERLWMIKYVVFLAILAISLNSITTAFELAEVEPFKTAITLKFVRDWPFVAYAVMLLAAGLFIERFYCRYLCPLGGALAIPARLRMFDWLKRYRECGAECQVCARRCTVQAIHPLGQINPNECIHCLQCQANYHDQSVCIHLIKREARRARPAAAPPPVPVLVRGKDTTDG
jgi:NosR/NirI family transcriptional regulator, nitrite reductase regulator